MNIMISAGHHPAAPGACHNGFCEHDEAVKWLPAIAQHLEGYAILVPPGVLANKVAFINSQHPTIALEVHFNSSPSGMGEGSETLYFPGSVRGRLLAECVQSHLSDVFSPNRGAKEGYYRMDRSKGPDYFLSRTKCTSIIVEPEFIRHRSKIENNREQGAVAIAQGILDYLDKAGDKP